MSGESKEGIGQRPRQDELAEPSAANNILDRQKNIRFSSDVGDYYGYEFHGPTAQHALKDISELLAKKPLAFDELSRMDMGYSEDLLAFVVGMALHYDVLEEKGGKLVVK